MEDLELDLYANKKCVIQKIRAVGISTCINRCTETARELFPEQRSRIESIRKIYSEISEEEFQDWQLERFISKLLDVMTEEQRHAFVAIEFVECRNK